MKEERFLTMEEREKWEPNYSFRIQASRSKPTIKPT